MFDTRQSDNDPLCDELVAEVIEHVSSGQVDLDVGFHVEQHPLHRMCGFVYGLEHAHPEVLGVREAERRVVAVDDEPGVVTASG